MTDHEGTRTMIAADITNASGPGVVRYRQLPGSIGVLEALDKPMPIGASVGDRLDRGRLGGVAAALRRSRRAGTMGDHQPVEG